MGVFCYACSIHTSIANPEITDEQVQQLYELMQAIQKHGSSGESDA